MLPAAAALQKQGANKGAVTAFMISTPESGVDSIAVSYALLDPILTVVRPVAALVSGIVAGLMENLFFWQEAKAKVTLSRHCPVDNCCDGVDCPDEIHNHHHTFSEKIAAGFRFGYTEVWGDIAPWFFIGLVLAAVIGGVLPDDLVAGVLGGGLVSMLVMLAFGIPLYICATASTPVAAALIMKGVSPGAALVFLLVGPATNITSLLVLSKILGKRGVFMYLLLLASTALAFGFGVDALYGYLGISAKAMVGSASELLPESIKLLAVLVLLALSIKPLWQWLKKKTARKNTPQIFISGFPQ